MKHIHRTDDEWMELITQCRRSGLSDERWCRDNDIPISTFYRHAKILRQKACDIPAHAGENMFPKQEVVPVQVTDIQETLPVSNGIETHLSTPGNGVREPAIRVHLGDVCIDVMNYADTALLSAVIMALKTLC